MEPVDYDEQGVCIGECAGCVNEKECDARAKEELRIKIRSLSDLKDYLYHTIMTKAYYAYYVLTYKRRIRRLTAQGMLYESDIKDMCMEEKIFEIEMAEFAIWQQTPTGKKEMDIMKERMKNIS